MAFVIIVILFYIVVAVNSLVKILENREIYLQNGLNKREVSSIIVGVILVVVAGLVLFVSTAASWFIPVAYIRWVYLLILAGIVCLMQGTFAARRARSRFVASFDYLERAAAPLDRLTWLGYFGFAWYAASIIISVTIASVH